MQFTHPTTFSTPGAYSSASCSSIFVPSPHTGAFAYRSTSFHRPVLPHPPHTISRTSISPLQKVVLSCFLQERHCSLSLTRIGELAVWMYLFTVTSSITSIGRPSATLSVQKMRGGVQLTTECPSGLVMRISSFVFLMKASLSMRV